MIEKEFAPYQEALALKELGFDEPCFGYYEPNKEFKYVNWEIFKDFPYLAKNSEWQDLVSALTFSQAFRWFREKYKVDSIIQPTYSTKYQYRMFHIEGKTKVQIYGEYMGKEFKTYEEAEVACLKKLIEIVKNK